MSTTLADIGTLRDHVEQMQHHARLGMDTSGVARAKHLALALDASRACEREAAQIRQRLQAIFDGTVKEI